MEQNIREITFQLDVFQVGAASDESVIIQRDYTIRRKDTNVIKLYVESYYMQ